MHALWIRLKGFSVFECERDGEGSREDRMRSSNTTLTHIPGPCSYCLSIHEQHYYRTHTQLDLVRCARSSLPTSTPPFSTGHLPIISTRRQGWRRLIQAPHAHAIPHSLIVTWSRWNAAAKWQINQRDPITVYGVPSAHFHVSIPAAGSR